jgi:hypothetical protein
MNLSENTEKIPKSVAINSCRLCLEIKKMSSMVFVFEDGPRKVEIRNMIEFCTGITVSLLNQLNNAEL